MLYFLDMVEQKNKYKHAKIEPSRIHIWINQLSCFLKIIKLKDVFMAKGSLFHATAKHLSQYDLSLEEGTVVRNGEVEIGG